MDSSDISFSVEEVVFDASGVKRIYQSEQEVEGVKRGKFSQEKEEEKEEEEVVKRAKFVMEDINRVKEEVEVESKKQKSNKQKCRVLVTGDYNESRGSKSTEIVLDAERSVKGPLMNVARYEHACVSLPNGNIGVFGGANEKESALASVEMFRMDGLFFSKTGEMLECRMGHAAVVTDGGIVVLSGGKDENGKVLSSCECLDPENGEQWFCDADMMLARTRHTASLLPNGNILFCGGSNGKNGVFSSTEIFDPVFGMSTVGPAMCKERADHTAATLPDGRIVISGGMGGESNGFQVVQSVEVYDPKTNSFTLVEDVSVNRHDHFAVTYPSGFVLLGGGGMFEMNVQAMQMLSPDSRKVYSAQDSIKGRCMAAAATFHSTHSFDESNE